MTKFFSKYLGKIVLMVAAVLWVGCNDKEESAEQRSVDSEKQLAKNVSEKEPPVSSSSATAKFDSIVRAKGHYQKIGANGELLECYQGMCGLAGLLYGSPMVNDSTRKKPKGFAQTPQKSDIEIVSGGNLAVDSIMKTLKQRNPGLRHIYNKYLRKKPGFAGNLFLTLTITDDGSVAKTTIKSSTTEFKEFDEKIALAVNRWIFDKSNGKTTLTIPFVFMEIEKDP